MVVNWLQNQNLLSDSFRNIAVTSDSKEMSLSIKRDLLRKLPPRNENAKYIVKIEGRARTFF